MGSQFSVMDVFDSLVVVAVLSFRALMAIFDHEMGVPKEQCFIEKLLYGSSLEILETN